MRNWHVQATAAPSRIADALRDEQPTFFGGEPSEALRRHVDELKERAADSLANLEHGGRDVTVRVEGGGNDGDKERFSIAVTSRAHEPEAHPDVKPLPGSTDAQAEEADEGGSPEFRKTIEESERRRDAQILAAKQKALEDEAARTQMSEAELKRRREELERDAAATGMSLEEVERRATTFGA